MALDAISSSDRVRLLWDELNSLSLSIKIWSNVATLKCSIICNQRKMSFKYVHLIHQFLTCCLISFNFQLEDTLITRLFRYRRLLELLRTFSALIWSPLILGGPPFSLASPFNFFGAFQKFSKKIKKIQKPHKQRNIFLYNIYYLPHYPNYWQNYHLEFQFCEFQ